MVPIPQRQAGWARPLRRRSAQMPTSGENATEKPPQYLTLIYQTNVDGAVLSLEAFRASDAARDALAK